MVVNIRREMRANGSDFAWLCVRVTGPEERTVNIVGALRKEESKFLREVNQAKQQLETVRAAIKLLSNGAKPTGRKVRKISAAARRKMSVAAKARWAKIKSRAS